MQVCSVVEDEEQGGMSAVEALGRAAVQSVRAFQVRVAQLPLPRTPLANGREASARHVHGRSGEPG